MLNKLTSTFGAHTLMQLNIDGIPIEVQKKNIRNAHLYVKPPLGKVHISAPLLMSKKSIEMFAQTNIEWIKKHVKKYENQPSFIKRQYVSGESFYIWGKKYILEFVPSAYNNFELKDDKCILSMPQSSSVLQREKYIREQYRNLLKIEVERLLPKWEKLTGLHCNEWRTKYMETRWGTCNTQKNRIWFNIQLAQKNIECLEYIILHELAHTKVSNHGKDFKAILNTFMPNWKEIQKELNTK